MMAKNGTDSVSARAFIKNEVMINPSAFIAVNAIIALGEMRPSTLGRELVRGFSASNFVSQKRLNAIAKFRAKISANAQRISVLAINVAFIVDSMQ